MSDSTPQFLPPLQVLRRLGGGGMADVFLARFESGEQVALKRLRPEVAADRNVFEQLKDEARICGLLAHEHIVGFKGVGVDSDGPYLALEYVEGLSASALQREWTNRHRMHLPLTAVLSLIADLAEGLEYAHTFRGAGVSGVIHRDVSPDNVLIATNGSAKLADFGIAKVLGATTVTHTGTVKGKLGYLAPELFDSASASPASDVFSLGATAYKLLAGLAPFQGGSEAQIVRAVLHNDPPPLATLRAEVPSDIAAWVDGSLHKDPKKRPPLSTLLSQLASVRNEGRAQLSACVLSSLPRASTTVVPDAASARQTKVARPMHRQGRRLLAGTGLFVGVSLATFATWHFTRTSPRPLPVSPEPARPALPVVVPEPVTPPPVAEKQTPSPPAPTEVAPPKPKPKPTPRPVLLAQPVRAETETTAPAKGGAPPALLTGTLRVKVRPWGEVFVDGKAYGTAPPLAPIKLAVGKHSVIVVNHQTKQTRTHEVEVFADQETELKVLVDEGG